MVAVTLFPTNGKAAAYHVTTSWSGARAATYPGNGNSRRLSRAEQSTSLLTVITAVPIPQTNLFALTSLKRRQCLVCVSVKADH